MVVLAVAGTVCAGTGDVDRLNGKTDEILRMHTAIQERYSQAVAIRRQLEGMRNDLTAEIVKERAQSRAADFSQAIRTPRIAYGPSTRPPAVRLYPAAGRKNRLLPESARYAGLFPGSGTG